MNIVYAPNMMFAERAEHVYFLAADNAPRFVDRVGQHLGVHCFYPSAPGVLEPPAHYVTTLYFDSDNLEVVRACESGVESVRLRAREYYDCDPTLGMRREPLVWLEIKTHSGSSTRKTRFAIPSTEICELWRGPDGPLRLWRGRDGVLTRPPNVVPRSMAGRSAEAVLHEIAELCTHAAGPLEPDCLAHYRRQAWQDTSETLRITLDTELGFHRPPANLFHDGRTLIDAVAGPPLAQLGSNLVEIKLRRDPPAWLGQLILDLGLEPALDGRRAFSKFVAASHAVHASKIL